ncbi:GlmU family protein [Pontibacter arcticus]|uniref:Glucose-1-phosphate thymidylyltransferase n=1 Tax=Pontibacter arcticus TaxID=2080288 RepID=A0A364RHN0_9BACT|nr:GlmU family protein [Pontibacter arcticus]RAU83775.1 glucose-1-phosphate thymidylyltransferase [Pontibacter arcticus]
MNIILFDDPTIRQNLLPLTFTRPVAEIRIGILTIAEKWRRHMGVTASYLTQPYLQQKYTLHMASNNIYVNGAVCPDDALVNEILDLKLGEALYQQGTLIALNGDSLNLNEVELLLNYSPVGSRETSNCTLIKDVWEIFSLNGKQIRADFNLITDGRTSQPITDKYTAVYGEENIFIEEGASIKAAVLNAEDGPIYIGKNAQVQEGSLIKGPFALCEGSHVNMGAKMRGDITVGPYSKVGGEISNSVIFGYTNKGHDGFLGNSVIGEWCNLGADTNNSNLKNNYAAVKLWNYAKGGFKNTGLQFCGLIMGDHSKCGINTMFNTGTVVGVSANIFGSGFPRNFVPSFSWGGASGFETFQLRKAYEVAEKVMERRSKPFDETEQAILAYVFEQTQQYRVWDKV